MDSEKGGCCGGCNVRRQCRSIFTQIAAAIAGALITMNLQTMISAITIVDDDIKELSSDNSTTSGPFTISSEQVSFYGTLQLYTHFAAGILSGLFQDRFGRRRCLILSVVPQTISWIILFFAKSVEWLYVHAILVGLSIALSEQTVITYLGEIAHVFLRGRLYSISKLGNGVGAFLVYFMNFFLPWRTWSIVFTILPVTSLFYVLWLPESPMWLMSKGRVEECKKSLTFLHGWANDEEIEEELIQLQENLHKHDDKKTSNDDKAVKLSNNTDETATTNGKDDHLTSSEEKAESSENARDEERIQLQEIETEIKEAKKQAEKPIGDVKESVATLHRMIEYVKLFSHPEFFQPFSIVAIAFFCSYLLALKPAEAYWISTLHGLGVEADSTKIMIVTSIASLVGSSTLALCVHKLGKRPLVLWTFSSTAICVGLLGVYSYLHAKTGFNFVWAVYVLLGLQTFFGGSTLNGLPWFICGEVFPQKIRGAAVGLTASYAQLLLSLLTRSYPFTIETITVTYVLLLYAAIGIACCVFFYYKLPETENKSLQEIEEYFSTGSTKKDSQRENPSKATAKEG